MTLFRPVPLESEAALRLLEEYFESRALTFPPEQGEYRPTYPRPEDFVPPQGLFLVVEGENLASEPADVGCGGIRRIADGEAGADGSDGAVRYEVKHLWLQPHTRGSGLGRALLRKLEQRARDFGATELVLDTNASLAAAGGLYRSEGFVEIEPYNDNPNATTWFSKVLL